MVFALEKAFDKAGDLYVILSKLYDKAYAKIERYNPEALIGMFTGFMLIFFGGFFVVTVALVEAFKQGGSETMFKNLNILSEQIKAVEQASAEDDKLDEDGDGIADVKQISKEQLASRKMRVALGAMDPLVVQEAFANLWTATVSAAATVKLQFARTIALGVTIGNYIYRPCDRYIIPLLEDFTNKTYHKWYPMVFSYICRAIGASVAFQIQRILSTVSTAVRGGHMMIDNFASFCETRGLTNLSDGYLDDIAAWCLVGLGIYTQLFLFTYLPLIIKLLFFPAFVTEWLLTTLVSTV